MEAAVFVARIAKEMGEERDVYDAILSRALRVRKKAAARIDAEWPRTGGLNEFYPID
jgi:hypothetical protein